MFPGQYNKHVSLWANNWAGLLAAPYKIGSFLRLGFLSCNANPLHVQYPPGLVCISPMGRLAWGRSGIDANMGLTMLTVQLSSKVLCLRSTSLVSSASVHEAEES